jgi:AsmA protein
MPSLIFNASIRDGYIANNKAPSPVKNLFLNFQSSLPGLNPDSLKVNIDSIFFNIDNDFVSSVIRLKGITSPEIFVKTNASIDLEKWDNAVGLKPLDFKGKLDFHLLATGRYATKVVASGVRKKDTVISSIPSFKLQSTLQNGYFKYASLPQAINNISFAITANCPDNNINHVQCNIDNINANALTNFIKGYVHIKNGMSPLIDADITSLYHLADTRQFYPLDSLDLAGDLHADIKTKGRYDTEKRLFPVTKAILTLNNGYIQTKYYPHPLDNIIIDATIVNTTGTLKGMNINIKPISFRLEGKPFTIKAALTNFDDLKYDIASSGVIDIGKVYQVFSRKGYNLTGIIKTNLSLQGLQSDATAGNYTRLFNKGTLQVKNIKLTDDAFPNPFFIKTGNFRFDQDKMWFDSFRADYGKTTVTLNGYLSNIINYAMLRNEPLQGNFNFTSDHVLVDEFMAFAGSSTTPAQAASTETGVVIVPANLSITLNAGAKTITYNGLDLHDFKGQVVIDSGKIKLNKTGFVIIDAPVTMDASYTSITPKKALFDYHVNVAEFDIQKAYNQIKLFHDMATSAAKAQGIVSLDYTIAGRLDANMRPVYPSLKGGGVLSLKKVKIKGLKLFGEVSKATGKNDINDPDLSKVNIKTTINNNIITISRTKMRVLGFRPRFEGQVSFDGNLSLQFRLGLPPFGIIGIPMTITGTEDNPKIKLGRAREELQEKDDDETENK